MTLPCRIGDLPLLHLTHIEERLVQSLVAGKPRTIETLMVDVWRHRPPGTARHSLFAAIYHLKPKIAATGYLLIFERGAGYSLLKDTRKFD